MRPPNRKGSEVFFMDIQQIISQMTLEEKAALCQGRSSWFTRAVERLGVPEMMMSDGPHGLRKQDLEKENGGVNDAIKAVCYPTAVGTACSFDRALLEEMGSLLGQTCQAEKVGVILGPAANIKRTPLCGRNFEYFSEDPYLSGEIAAAHIRGVQSQGVGTSLKHFAANNQETRRMTVSANVDERTLREIYLASFEGAVKGGHPWTVMCAYNKLNGVYCSENPWLLTQVLRKEWGFDGLVMSDWGAVNDRVKGVPAGLELEMPESGPAHDRDLVAAVREGRLKESDLDTTCERIADPGKEIPGQPPGGRGLRPGHAASPGPEDCPGEPWSCSRTTARCCPSAETGRWPSSAASRKSPGIRAAAAAISPSARSSPPWKPCAPCAR